jgi:hypothetical protein
MQKVQIRINDRNQERVRIELSGHESGAITETNEMLKESMSANSARGHEAAAMTNSQLATDLALDRRVMVTLAREPTSVCTVSDR